MEIRELERLIRMAIHINPAQPALATLAVGSGGSSEFNSAITTLTERESHSKGNNTLLRAAAAWL